MKNVSLFRLKPLTISLIILLGINTTLLPRRHKTKKSRTKKTEQQQQTHVQSIATKNAYDTLLDSQKTVFIKFSADWCGACKILDPIFHDVAQEYGDKALFAAIDVDTPALSEVTQEFNIRGIPAIVAAKNNKMIDKKVGSCEKSALSSFISKNIKLNAKKSKQANKKEQTEKSKKTSLSITTYDELEKLKKTSPYLIVKLEADWCGACSYFTPAFNAVASKYDDKAKFASINIEQTDEKLRTFISPYKRRGIPAVMYIHNGEVVDTSVGSYPESTFESKVKNVLQKQEQPSQKKAKQPTQDKKKKEKAQQKKQVSQKTKKESVQKKVHNITTYDKFEKLKKTSPYLVVKLEADWCGACTHFNPAFNAIADRYSDKALFASINTENANNALLKFISPYKKRGIPAVMYIYNGKVVDTSVGSYSERGFEVKVQNLLQKTEQPKVNSKSSERMDTQQRSKSK